LPSSVSPSRLILANLTVAFLYAAAGCLAVELAIPTATATPIWPSAGFALAGVIVLGYRALPGVFLGCFAFNVWNALANLGNEEIGRTALTGAFLATGATIQRRWGSR
jgi:integral membrane sensor domain MASE1